MPEAIAESRQVAAFLAAQEVKTLEGSLYDDALRRRMQKGEFEMLIVIGGDGTMLRAGRLCAPLKVPDPGDQPGPPGFPDGSASRRVARPACRSFCRGNTGWKNG